MRLGGVAVYDNTPGGFVCLPRSLKTWARKTFPSSPSSEVVCVQKVGSPSRHRELSPPNSNTQQKTFSRNMVSLTCLLDLFTEIVVRLDTFPAPKTIIMSRAVWPRGALPTPLNRTLTLSCPSRTLQVHFQRQPDQRLLPYRCHLLRQPFTHARDGSQLRVLPQQGELNHYPRLPPWLPVLRRPPTVSLSGEWAHILWEVNDEAPPPSCCRPLQL